MALLEKQIINGIQLGNGLDFCLRCNKKGQPLKTDLEYKEVFKLTINGLSHCLCMKHFQELLGPYALVPKDSLEEKDSIVLPKELVNNGTEDDVINYIKAELARNE